MTIDITNWGLMIHLLQCNPISVTAELYYETNNPICRFVEVARRLEMAVALAKEATKQTSIEDMMPIFNKVDKRKGGYLDPPEVT